MDFVVKCTEAMTNNFTTGEIIYVVNGIPIRESGERVYREPPIFLKDYFRYETVEKFMNKHVSKFELVYVENYIVDLI